MMKYLYTLIALLAMSSMGYSQITWEPANADTARGFETNPDIETHNKVTFTKAGTYRWLRTNLTNCKIQTAICDKNSCYLETTDSADFTVTAGESFDMICHFYPYDSCCPKGASVSLYVFKIDEPTENSTALYHLDLWCDALSVADVYETSIQIMPNPASDQIEISSVNAIQNVVITNLIGESIQVEQLSSNRFDISALKQGIYLITVLSENKAFTQRFIKQ